MPSPHNLNFFSKRACTFIHLDAERLTLVSNSALQLANLHHVNSLFETKISATMMLEGLHRFCGRTEKKISASRKLKFAAGVFSVWFCLKSISLMYQIVQDTEAAVVGFQEEGLKEVSVTINIERNYALQGLLLVS